MFRNVIYNRPGVGAAPSPFAPAAATATRTAVRAAAQAAWSTMQTAVVAIGVAAGVGALGVAAAGLIVAAITTFNLNSYYYGQINALSDAVLNPDGPLYVNTTSGAVFLDCASGGAFSLCAYTAYVNGTIATFTAFMNNGTIPNVTLASLPYASPAPFMANVSEAEQAIDNLVGEALALQSQLDSLPPAPTLLTLSYANGAPFMANVTNGKTALDNLVGEDMVLLGQIAVANSNIAAINATVNALVVANGTATLATLLYTNPAPFMANVTTGQAALDNLVGEALVLQSQLDNLPPAPTLLTLAYTNGAPFMANVTNGQTALDNLVGEALLQAASLSAVQTSLSGISANVSTLFVDFLNQQVALNGYGNNITFLFTSDATLQVSIAGLTYNVTTLFSGVVTQQATNALLQAEIDGINARFTNGSILATNVFDTARNASQALINAATLSSLTTLTTTTDTLQSEIDGINARFTNGSILATNVFDTARNASQALINAATLSSLTTLTTTTDTLQSEIDGINARFTNGSILAVNVFDTARNASQALINAATLSSLNTLTTTTGTLQSEIDGINARFTNGSITTAAVYDTTQGAFQSVINAATLGRLAAVMYMDILVNPSGNDGTCSVGGSACATLAGAYALIPASVSEFAVYRILVSGYIVESGATTVKCNVAVQGDDATYWQTAGVTLDAASAAANGACTMLFRNVYFVLNGAFAVDVSPYSGISFFAAKFENFSTQGANSQAFSFTGNANYNALTFTQVGNVGGSIAAMSITNMHVYSYGFFDAGAPLSIAFDNKDGSLDLNNVRVPSGGIAIANNNSHTLTLQGSAWSNPNSQGVTVYTAAGSTTYPRGDASFLGIVNAGAASYGLLFSGAGSASANAQRTEGAIGVAALPDVPANWLPSPSSVQDALDQLASRAPLSTYLGAFLSSSGGTTGANSCGFTINLNVGPTYTLNTPLFAQGGSADLTYSGPSTGFSMSFSAIVTFTYAATADPYAVVGATLTAAGSGATSYTQQYLPLSAGGTTALFKLEWSDVIFFAPGDDITAFVNINGASSTTFSACSISTSSNVPYIKFVQLT